MSSCQLLYHLCPHCRLSGMLTFGHCIQLAGSLFQCWSSMLPSAFVSVDNATYQSGGTDVVDLPDILLPEDQYLEMFDSESDISGDNSEDETNKQKFKVRQPQRAAKSKRPNAPADGSKNNGIHTTKQEEYPSRHPTTDTANSSTSKQTNKQTNKAPAGD